MDSHDLVMFKAVADHGGITRAAEHLHCVQSNVTARIRNLEQELGLPLFRRHSRGVELTPAGQRLLPYAEKIGALLREGVKAARDDGTPQGGLAIGSLETTAAVRLPPVVAAYRRQFAQVDLTIRTGTSAELVEAVLDHQVDLALAAPSAPHPDLVIEPVWVEEMVMVTAAGANAWPPVGNPTILVFRAGCSYRNRLERLLAGMGAETPRCMEFGTLEGIIGCVAAGVGITLLPRAVIARIRPAGIECHNLDHDTARVVTGLIRRADAYPTAAVTAFIACAHAFAVESPPASGASACLDPLQEGRDLAVERIGVKRQCLRIAEQSP
jgi:LysR family transcriptional regulator, cell division regulator